MVPKPLFLYAGNAGVVHGADVFVRAAAELWAEGKDFDLVYMGHGQDMEGIASLQKSQESRLWLVPPQPAEVVAAAYRGAIGALSSLRPFSSYEDARPIKTMSGLAAGCPPVYAGGGRFAEELAARELGFVDEWSVEGAKRAMLGALQLNRLHPDKALEMRDRCAVFARDFLDDRHAAEAAANFFLHGSPKS